MLIVMGISRNYHSLNYDLPFMKTPLMRQFEMRECGVVALQIILAHYGKHIPRQELREACRVSRDGVKVIDIVHAARRYGMNARVFRRETLEGLATPFVIYWNFNHFLVVESVTPHGIWVNDPTSGRVYRSSTLVKRYFTGITLHLEPGAEFSPSGNPAPLIPKAILHPQSLIYIGVQTARAFVEALFIAVIVSGLPSFWLLISIIWFVLYLWARHALAQRYTARTGGAALQHIAHLPTTFFARYYAHEIASRLMLPLDDLHTQTADQLAAVMRGMIYVGALLVLSPWFSVALIAVGLRLTTAIILRDAAKKWNSEHTVSLQRLNHAMYHTVQNLESVKLQNGEGAFLDQLQRLQKDIHHQHVHWPQTIQIGVDLVIVIALLGFVMMLTQIGVINPIIAISGFCLMLLFIAPEYHQLLPVLRSFSHELARLEDAMAQTANPVSEDQVVEGIHLENVGLHIDGGERLRGISLAVANGKKLGIVGRSGSGKTTLIGLIAGFYPPTTGTVRLKHSAAVLLDGKPTLFDGTIQDNLRLFDDSITTAQVNAALKTVGLDTLIQRLRDGLETPISPERHPFSAGELQCLEIARTLLRKPEILLLDEATHALDPSTEAHLMDELREYTQVIAAHRLSAIRACDEIIVLDDLTIAERGTHESLLAAGGVYTRLIAEQTLT